ncbi:MAG TPA: hypothetical protein VLM89_03690, partial [Phycisphaerae bacterium]|nr:hypothetical protein [Phycisphaerae bacterium]
MSWTLLTLWTSCCLVATSTNPALKDLPAHLPPLPDFKQPVDYIQWLRDRLTAPPGDDARPLYDEIFVQSGDSEAIQKAKSRLWGEDEKGRLEGMFTGDEEFPERYAWDPADHPKWEAAYQAQVAAGLPEKLRAIGKRKQLSQPFGFYDPREAITSSPGDEGGAASQPDIGLTAEDRLLINVLMPSLSPNRRIVKVLLQNAWRAPQGKVSPKAMEDAIRTAISVADQASSHTVIGHLVSNANHELIYMSMLRALRENVFGPSETVKMMQILSMQDKRIQTQAEYDSEEIAQMLDLLQFIYQPTPDGVPKPNPDRLKRLARYLAALKAAYPEYHETVLDVVGLIGKC